MNMFCFQCQEAAKNQGCTARSVCGKTADVANLQDLLIWLLKGVSFYGLKARELGISDPEADLFVAQSLFSTITNVNFDPQRFVLLVDKALTLRDRLQVRFLEAYQRAHGGRHFQHHGRKWRPGFLTRGIWTSLSRRARPLVSWPIPTWTRTSVRCGNC